MKTLLLCLALMTSFAYADHHEEGEMKAERFAKIKDRALDNITKRMEQMEKAKKCIQNSKEMKDLKACREKGREKMKEMRGKMKDKREKRKAKRSQEDND